MSYVAPLKDMLFNIEHLARIDQVAQMPGFEDAGLETAQAVLEEWRLKESLGEGASAFLMMRSKGKYVVVSLMKSGSMNSEPSSDLYPIQKNFLILILPIKFKNARLSLDILPKN